MSLEEILAKNQRKDLLRLLTCGSVDDGKSTLIGRLLHDSKVLYEDHLSTLERDSKRVGSAGEALDFALLLDGLQAEREQGITIDVAYRYFSTPRRKFIIADCPGHVQYTRNMVTGASTANLAIVLVDATKGVLDQTRRHSFLASLLDIGHIVVAVNKMDLVDYSEQIFEAIRDEYTDFSTRLDVRHVSFIPISALAGDNVVDHGDNMPWYHGAPLLEYLERVHIASDRNLIDLRYPVQYVIRPDRNYRGYAGTVASGILRPGTSVTVLPSGVNTRIASILGPSGEIDEAFPPMSVAITVEDEVDISRGDMIVHPRNTPRMDRELEAVVVWMSERPMAVETPYIIKHCTKLVRGSFARLRYRFDVNTLSREPAQSLALNEIGRVHLELEQTLAFDPYIRNRTTGSFIIIDPMSNVTVGAGMILDRRSEPPGQAELAERGSVHVKARTGTVTGEERRHRLAQKPATLWLTGLPKSGKSTIAYALERTLFDAGFHVHVLDGENLRLGISQKLGFGALERSENVHRVGHVARLCNDAGLVTIVALVSPFAADRQAAREIVGTERFHEIHLSAPVEVCEGRDQDGLYQRARTGEIARFTGVSAPYEAPAAPDLVLPTHEFSADEAVVRIVEYLRAHAVLEEHVATSAR
jgi:bifunctional enzyme CysN/CysC